jgi:hypothetical protein
VLGVFGCFLFTYSAVAFATTPFVFQKYHKSTTDRTAEQVRYVQYVHTTRECLISSYTLYVHQTRRYFLNGNISGKTDENM